jgi:DNA-binding transcriptional LysR family regulator
MRRIDRFAGLSEVLAVAETGSFRAAAAQLGVTPAAISQAVRGLELRAGLPLFQRTTRRVALTEAGEALLERLRPAAADIGAAMETLAAMSGRPSGLLRLSVPRFALSLAVETVVAAFRAEYPEVGVELAVDNAAIDLTAERFDAGVRIGEAVERDMIAVPLTPPFRWLAFGSPEYFARRPPPERPEDLAGHECIRFRNPRARTLYRWEFLRGGKTVAIDVPGGLIVNDGDLALDLAARGLGLAYTADRAAAAHPQAARLVPVLADYAHESPGLHLYFPARNQTQPKLRAFIDVARRVTRH